MCNQKNDRLHNRLNFYCQILKDFINKHYILFLFSFFFIFYFTLGQNMNYTFISDTFDSIFGADTPRVIKDLTIPEINHYRCAVHTLMLIILQPIVAILKSIIRDTNLTILLLQSVLGSSCVCLIFSILKNLTNKKELSVIISTLFGVSFSTMLFCSIPESYIFSAFFQLLFWHYIILLGEQKPERLSAINIGTIALLGVFSFGIILVNFVSFIIGIIYLLNKLPNKRTLNFFAILAAFGIIFMILSTFQNLSWGSFETIIDKLSNYQQNHERIQDYRYMNFSISLSNLNDMLPQSLAAPITLPNFNLLPSERKNYFNLPTFTVADNFSIINITTLLFFYLIPLLYLLKNFKNFKYKSIIISMISIVFLNTLFNVFYGYTCGQSECILYTLNYLFAVFITLGLIIAQIKNEKIIILYRLLIQYLIIINIWQFIKIKRTIFNFTLMENNFILKYLTVSIIICSAIIAVYIFAKHIVSREIKALTLIEKFQFYPWVYCIFMIMYAILAHLEKIRIYQ